MFGVINGLVLNENERMDAINSRIAQRTVKANADYIFSPRPAATRCVLMPTVIAPTGSEPIRQKEPLPFMQNVDDESTLWNIQFAANNCDLTYIPSSTSDMYKVSVPSTASVQTHPLLFTSSVHKESTPMPTSQTFYNVRVRQKM
jgi:hypothetical protein